TLFVWSLGATFVIASQTPHASARSGAHEEGGYMRRIVILVLCLLAPRCWGQGALENPAPNSHQSGIGLISGWYCDANSIDAFIDGRILVPVAYGTPRGAPRQA